MNTADDMPPVRWLVFDLGGVLVQLAPTEPSFVELAERSKTPLPRLKALLAERFDAATPSLSERFQLGELAPDAFIDELNAALHEPLPSSALATAINARLAGENTDTLALLAALSKQGQRLACFSNTNAMHWAIIQRDYRCLEYFEHAFASHELGLAKPDPRGFAQVASVLGAAPAQCLLIDDLPANIDGARRAGWQALRFDNATQLQQALLERGLLSGAV